MFGWQNSSHFFSQWEAKPKQNASCTCAFSRAWCRLHVIILNYVWFTELASLLVTDQSNYFSFGFNWKTCLSCTIPVKTSKVVTVIAPHVIPSVTVLSTKTVHTVFVSPVIWLLWRPEPEAAYFSVGPNERSFNTSVIQTNPASFTVMSMLNVNIFFLVVNRHQTWAHSWTVWFSGQPWCACGAREVAVTTKVAPSWLA